MCVYVPSRYMHLFNAGRAIPPGRKSATRNGWANFLFRNALGPRTVGISSYYMHIHTYICGVMRVSRVQKRERAHAKLSIESARSVARCREIPVRAGAEACRKSCGAIDVSAWEEALYLNEMKYNLPFPACVLWACTRGARYDPGISGFELGAYKIRYFVLNKISEWFRASAKKRNAFLRIFHGFKTGLRSYAWKF